MGNSFENIVFNVLNQKYKDIYYLRDTYEVDFFCDNKLFQVSYDNSNPKTKQREISSFTHLYIICRIKKELNFKHTP